MVRPVIPNIAYVAENEGTIEIIDLHTLQQRRFDLDHDSETPHRVEFYMVIQIDEGHGSHFVDFRRHEFRENSLIFINKHQVQAFDFKKPLHGKVILFTDEFINQVQANMRTPLFTPFYLSSQWKPVFTPGPDLMQHCRTLINEASQELQHPRCQDMIVMLLFSAAFMMIMREKNIAESALSSKQLMSFQHFASLLEERFTQTRDASDYADSLNITYKTLNQLCKQVNQQTAKQVIDNYTILEAKRRLVLSGEPIQQLAYGLGFDEPTNFIKYFKKHTQLTPSQFRKQSKP